MIRKWINGIRELAAYLLLQTYDDRKADHQRILSIYFHDPSEALFEGIIKWLKQQGYRFISVQELDSMIRKKETGHKLAFISFDDGWKNNLKLLPIIEKYEVPTAIFIPTGPIREGNYWWEYAEMEGQSQHTGLKSVEEFKVLPGAVFREKVDLLRKHYQLPRSSVTMPELKMLRDHKWITLGAHTVSHPILDRLAADEQAYELSESKKTLSEWIGEEVDYIAYPNGDFNGDTLRLTKETGYKLGFTVIPGRIDAREVRPYEIPRNTIDDHRGYYENLCKVVGVWQTVKDKLMTALAMRPRLKPKKVLNDSLH